MAEVRGLLGFFNAFRGGGVNDRKRPGANVGVGFLLAAALVALFGLNWLSPGGGSNDDSSLALGDRVSTDESGTTAIPPSPAAIAVQVGANGPGDSIDPDGTSSTATGSSDDDGATLPDGTPIDTTTSSDPGSAGGSEDTTPTTSDPGSTTTVSTVDSTPTTTPTTEPTTTSTTEDPTTTTTEVPPAPSASEGSDDAALLETIGGLLGGLFG